MRASLTGPRLHAAWWVLACAGCQGPFDVLRDELGPFRIAAVGVDDGYARAAIWSGDGPGHATAPHLAWSVDGEALGEGWQVAVPDSGTLGLVATAADGTRKEAQVSIGASTLDLGVWRGAVDLEADLSLDARRAADAVEVRDTVTEGQAARLELVAADGAEALPDAGQTVRWMTAQGLGTLLELDTWSADVFAEEIVFDDGEVESRLPLGTGTYLQLALVIDGTGANRWAWVDAAVGVDAPMLRHGGRLLVLDDADAVPDVGLVSVSLDVQDGALVVSQAVGDAGLDDGDALACARTDAPFELAWVVEGRCGLDEVDGARVVLETW